MVADRGGETERAGFKRLAQDLLHIGDVVVGRGTAERTLLHNRNAQRGVPNLSAVVDRFRSPGDRIEKLRERLPGPVDAL